MLFSRYASVSFVLLLIKNFGATFTEVVKSTRKVQWASQQIETE